MLNLTLPCLFTTAAFAALPAPFANAAAPLPTSPAAFFAGLEVTAFPTPLSAALPTLYGKVIGATAILPIPFAILPINSFNSSCCSLVKLS